MKTCGWMFRVALLLAAGAAAPTPAVGALVLSEILADPARDWNGDGVLSSRDDEWVEVLNTGPETVDLSECYVRDALDPEAHLRLTGLLAPGEVKVFYGDDAVVWQQSVGYTVTGLSWNNTGDTCELWRGDPTQAGAQLVDVYIFKDHEAEDDRSSARLVDGSWALCDYLYPYAGSQEPLGTGCAPSPGRVNDCEPNVPADAASWGGVKDIYR